MAPVMFENVLLFVELCHWIVPVLPLSVKIVPLVPEQTVAAPLTVPATDTGITVTVATALFTALHNPLVTTAL